MFFLRQFCLSIFFVLAACSVSLAPDYDQALHDGLNNTNQSALTLFSALSGGSSKAQFGKYEKTYNEVIGAFGALLSRANSRPEPVLSQRLSTMLNRHPKLKSICASVPEDTSCATVTPLALIEIIQTISKIRDRHRSKGILASHLLLLTNDYEISIEQALTVEAALKR